jgi:hypothetical protein
MGKLQRKAMVLSKAGEAIDLNRKGWSGEKIAKHMGCTTQTIRNYLRRFLETESRYGIETTPETVAEMRAEALDHIQTNQRRILQRMERLQALQPEDVDEEVAIAVAICKSSDSFIRASEHVANMFGLMAPKAQVSTTTNNNLMISGGDEVAYLRDLARLKELQRNGQSRTTEV